MSGGGDSASGRAATSPARRTEDAHDGSWHFVLLGGAGPARVELGAQRLVVGRDPECQVRLTGTEASRRHAEIVREGAAIVLRDLGSSNGTFVNGARVRETVLAPQSVVRIGEWISVLTSGPNDGVDPAAFVQHGAGLWGGATLGRALATARAAAPSDLSIVLEGETGTGKELVARAIHEWSGRAGPFVAINCGALPDTLVEAELFGYRRGAFTGADRASPGYFREAQHGTLLLDEVCDLSLATQVKLLRVLEQREVVPLGESRPVPIDVRVIAAAQQPLAQAVGQQRFRADLCARLDGLTVPLPALRERIEDVPKLLARFMSEERAGTVPALSINMLELLCSYDWPFNVRELRLLARRLGLLHQGAATLHRRDLPQHMRTDQGGKPLSTEPPAPSASAAGELERLIAGLRTHQGNVSRAARDAGISRMRAYRLMNASSELDLEKFRHGEAES